MKTLHYELWFYDVWGNEEEGFKVNDRHCMGRDFTIKSNPKTYNRGTKQQFTDFVPTNKQILQALVDAGELKESALIPDNVEIDGDDQYIYLTESNGFPLCELILKEDQTNYEY